MKAKLEEKRAVSRGRNRSIDSGDGNQKEKLIA
jgi:hypothetical protein